MAKKAGSGKSVRSMPRCHKSVSRVSRVSLCFMFFLHLFVTMPGLCHCYERHQQLSTGQSFAGLGPLARQTTTADTWYIACSDSVAILNLERLDRQGDHLTLICKGMWLCHAFCHHLGVYVCVCDFLVRLTEHAPGEPHTHTHIFEQKHCRKSLSLVVSTAPKHHFLQTSTNRK